MQSQIEEQDFDARLGSKNGKPYWGTIMGTKSSGLTDWSRGTSKNVRPDRFELQKYRCPERRVPGAEDLCMMAKKRGPEKAVPGAEDLCSS